MPTDPRIREAMAELARTLQTSRGTADTLAVLTRGAQNSVPGVDFASITVRLPDGRLETRAATDPLVNQCDQIQYDLHEGPCYEAAAGESAMLVSEHLESDVRWPGYGPKVAALGIGSQMALDLSPQGGWDAALNLYSLKPHGFSTDAMEVAELFASHAALALGFARTVETLDQALNTRRLIGQAVGVVMERYQLNDERAFAFLVRVSQASNVKLRVVAQQIVDGLNRL